MANLFVVRVLLLCSVFFCAHCAVGNLDVQAFLDGSFSISVGGKPWFRSGSVGVRDLGRWWSQHDNSVDMAGNSKSVGVSKLGTFSSYQYEWKAVGGDSTLRFMTVISVYDEVPAVLFDVVFLDKATNTNISDCVNLTLSSFPSFVIEDGPVERGYVTWSGNMAAFMKIDKWSPDTPVYGDIDGGFPLVVFDSEMENAVVMAPATDFMSANQATFTDPVTGEKTLAFGPLSSITELPQGYTFSTILVAGDNVTDAMMLFGNSLKTLYGKDDSYRKTDFTINYLGYWTDNGACYYYDTGNYSNYEEILDAVIADADRANIPFRYLQIDSWWYFKGPDEGVKNWTAMPSVFPNGIEAVVKKTGLPMEAHNRWWSPQTDYAKQNGGKFDFIIESEASLPVDPDFWDFLLSSSKDSWNLLVYEQDWLYVTVAKLNALKNTAGLGRMWLKQMGDAALRYDLTIQYCMPWPRHLLQSVEIPAVTQTRVSDDYTPGNSQWQIGDTTILANALGLAAFKDNFHTAVVEKGCHNTQNEPAPALETYAAALSGGPIGPSDHVLLANKTLIMATCMTDGRLLKPTHPAMSLDSTFLYRAFKSSGPNGQLWAAFTEVGSFTWYYIISGTMASTYKMHASELPPSKNTKPKTSFPPSLAFTYTLDGKVQKAMNLTGTLDIAACSVTDFQYWSLAPILENGWALLGELNKIIPVSETRFMDLAVESNDISVGYLAGVPGEMVSITAYDTGSGRTEVYRCTIGADGNSAFYFPGGTCIDA
jgi:hypothetical protein